MMPAPHPVCGLRKHPGGKDNFVIEGLRGQRQRGTVERQRKPLVVEVKRIVAG